jgi:hypothetical protein
MPLPPPGWRSERREPSPPRRLGRLPLLPVADEEEVVAAAGDAIPSFQRCVIVKVMVVVVRSAGV